MSRDYVTIRPLGPSPIVMAYMNNGRPIPRAIAVRPGIVDRIAFSTPAPFANARFNGITALGAIKTPGGSVLRPGATGPAVGAVQQALIDMGFVIPGGAGRVYNAATWQAVKNFQAMAGLSTDGIVGPTTLGELDRFAPPPDTTSWTPGANPGPLPDPDLGNGKKARIVVSISQHRLFLFDRTGTLEHIYGVRTGRVHDDGRGGPTMPGIKVIDGKNDDPREVSNRLWPEAGGNAFGTRLLGLSDYDPKTGKTYRGAHAGQELHGTTQDSSIGRNFSHGCVGLRNADIEAIFAGVRTGDLVRFVP